MEGRSFAMSFSVTQEYRKNFSQNLVTLFSNFMDSKQKELKKNNYIHLSGRAKFEQFPTEV